MSIGVKHAALLGGVVCKVGTICEDSPKGNVVTVEEPGKNAKVHRLDAKYAAATPNFVDTIGSTISPHLGSKFL